MRRHRCMLCRRRQAQRRRSADSACCAKPTPQAREAYAKFLEQLRAAYVPERVQDGVFGAMMDVELVGGWAVGCGWGVLWCGEGAPRCSSATLGSYSLSAPHSVSLSSPHPHPLPTPRSTTAPSPSFWTRRIPTTARWAARPAWRARCPRWTRPEARSARSFDMTSWPRLVWWTWRYPTALLFLTPRPLSHSPLPRSPPARCLFPRSSPRLPFAFATAPNRSCPLPVRGTQHV